MSNQSKELLFTDIMARFIGVVATRLPDDVYKKLAELREKEDTDIAKVVYDTYFDNLDRAIQLGRPCCQDTGILNFYIKAGANYPHLSMVAKCLKEATMVASENVPLRQNAKNYFEEINTKNNTGEKVPWIHWDIVPDNDELEITTYLAGGGCALPGRAKVLTPSEGYEGIIKYVFDTMVDMGINACPPLVVGIGLGTSAEIGALLSKKAYLRPLGTKHPDPRGAEMEELIEEGLNKLGIGAQGLKGNNAVLGVHIESSARHTATIGVGINFGCYAHRRGTIIFDKDMGYRITSYEGVTI